jgi:hypothetical protein
MANPNPSPLTRFGAENGNPSGAGKSKGQRAAEIKAAEISAQLRERALSELLEKVEAGEIKAHELIDANSLRLFKDSEDRAHGTPKQAMDLTSDGEPIPFAGVLLAPLEAYDDETEH